MQITVRLLASFRQHALDAGYPGSEYPCQFKEGMLVSDVLPTLPIPPGDAYTFLVNGRHARPDQVLQEGDHLTVFPAAGGG